MTRQSQHSHELLCMPEHKEAGQTPGAKEEGMGYLPGDISKEFALMNETDQIREEELNLLSAKHSMQRRLGLFFFLRHEVS